MKKFKKLLASCLTFAMVLSMSACGGAKAQDTTSAGNNAATEAAAPEEKIVFGTNAEFPPFEFVTGSGVIGEFDGIDIAIAKNIGDSLGKEAVINNMEFDSLVLALQNGQIDAAIAGMTIDPERAETVDDRKG